MKHWEVSSHVDTFAYELCFPLLQYFILDKHIPFVAKSFLNGLPDDISYM